MLDKFYPEVGAGGFTRIDGTISFYLRVNALVSGDDVLLDVGAGRGNFVEDPICVRRELRSVAKRAGKSIAADVDDAVLENVSYTDRIVLHVGERWPLADDSVDLVLADWTLEHVEDPLAFAQEVQRVLRPGGWFCARTPNKWGITGIATRLVPNSRHMRILKRIVPNRNSVDTFPTFFRMNTRSSLDYLFPAKLFSDFSYCADPEPGYAGNSKLAWLAFQGAKRVLPERLATVRYIFKQLRC